MWRPSAAAPTAAVTNDGPAPVLAPLNGFAVLHSRCGPQATSPSFRSLCRTLNALYHECPAAAPRLLFKGGTSLSKAYGLIQRFSEDIDITVFRDDLDEPASVRELEALSNQKRRAKLEAK